MSIVYYDNVQALVDTSFLLETKPYYKKALLEVLGRPSITVSEIEDAIPHAASVFFKTFKHGKALTFYRKFIEDNPNMIPISEEFAEKIIPLTTIYYLAGDPFDARLKFLGSEIVFWKKVYEMYCDTDIIFIGDFNVEDIAKAYGETNYEDDNINNGDENN